MTLRPAVLFILPITVFVSPLLTAAQEQHQAREWRCVRQPFAETTDGNVVVLQCVAVLPKDEKLDAEDEDILKRLQIIRYNATTFRQTEQGDPKNWSPDSPKGIELKNTLRMGFGQKVGQLCQKHPNIVLAPLFPDLTSGTTMLYGCKNIATAPEK